jgi:predicted metalloprotease with PDZ domain
MATRVRLVLAVLVVLVPADVRAQAPVEYTLTFPDATHRLMNVDVRFTDVPDGAFELRMSRSSPGRYALHEFAKNVFDVRITDERNTPLPVMRTDPSAWTVTDHRGTVRVSYRVFGDRVDGTYLGIDSSHAHINMPAALMWARGFDLRPVTIRFVPPSGSGWRAATQLFPGPDALTFTAPNFQYLMDSPTELSGFGLRTFTIADAPRAPTIRLAVHHTGADAELDDFARDVERIVREATAVYGELPAFDTNSYTFIAEYTPWSNGDGMEHRNSTILTSAGSIRANRLDLLDTISHEFFHAWNVERIRPRALEPFRFDEANMSGELWLAEGVTSYYGPLVLLRAGLSDLAAFTAEMASVITTVMSSPGRQVRSAEEMSRMAPFVDAAVSVDRTAFENTYISYYTWGEAIGLGLDLTLRARSSGKVTLDHFMRAMWQKHGKPGGRAPGYVDAPYTMADVQAVLASVSGDSAFADDFLRRFVQGREIVDYARLLDRAGLVLRKAAAGRAFAGDVRLAEVQGRLRVADNTPFDSPAYHAGLDRDDIIVSLAGTEVSGIADFERLIRARKPGDDVAVVFLRRGERVMTMLRLAEDPTLEIVRTEDLGRPLTDAQRQFRNAWLSSSGRNTF